MEKRLERIEHKLDCIFEKVSVGATKTEGRLSKLETIQKLLTGLFSAVFIASLSYIFNIFNIRG